jgi:asparagine synthase (glutamine-hydrolysing)
MSIQFGRWNFDGKPVDPGYLEKVKPMLSVYGPDDAGCYAKQDIAILHHAFHSTKESLAERQPRVTSSGCILVWDGRLDNRKDLIGDLSGLETDDTADIEIVAAAFDAWRLNSLEKLIGDWPLSIWDPAKRSLLLARDCMGARPLCYSFDQNRIVWSTILDPLVRFAENTLKLSEEYISGWISSFPDSCLTPYVAIRSVPPCSFVLIRQGEIRISKYWDFDPRKILRYRLDSDYEEHFRTVFAESVRRRLRSQNPILAELSGGMDSSSIVCMADTVLAQGAAQTPRVDTLSYFNDSEPNWNEKIYFARVEEKRRRVGCHIDVSSEQYFELDRDCIPFPATPASAGHSRGTHPQFADCLKAHGIRVLLSGIGGDEVLGGVPTPIPELADLMMSADLFGLGHQLRKWSLEKRKPWFHLLFQAIHAFLPRLPVSAPIFSWLHEDFVGRNRLALFLPSHRYKVPGPRPSFQTNLSTLDGLRSQLACISVPSIPMFETRYPFLDRSVLEFVYAIPRDQLIRPGQRRSLMRRALAGIVPDELLNRRRKGFIARGPLIAAATDWPGHIKNSGTLLVDALGVVNTHNLISSLESARGRSNIPIVPLMRVIALERWLRSLSRRNILPASLASTELNSDSGEFLSAHTA